MGLSLPLSVGAAVADKKNTILHPIHYFADTLNGSWLNKSKLELYDYTPQQTISNETEQIQLMTLKKISKVFPWYWCIFHTK
jgi:hypothetical protein